ncbi:MAG TPA: hypothetical protein VN805_02460 [Caulobacteraceae bacterium]|nr:hypothetical protein [Caulobacteraceae bacterium]
MRATLSVLLTVAAMAVAVSALADPPAPVVTVTAKPKPSPSLNHQTYAFVNDIAAQAPGESLVRWGAPICPYAVGLGSEQNAGIAHEIALVANAASAPVATTDCHPNFVVVVTSQPDRLLAAWRKRDPDLFGDGLPSDISRFLTKERPVRVWYNALRTTVDGEAITQDRTQFYGAPTLSSFTLSRLRFETVLGLQSAIVVVDANQVQGFTIGQIADYAAMVGLAELNLDRDLGEAPTILRLFSAAAADRPAGMTDWDKGFLAGMYRSDQASRLQRSTIAASVSAAAAGSSSASP